MVVRKILEATLVAGSTSVTFTDTDIPNSLLRVYCTRSALFPLSQTLSGNSVTVTYKPQDSNIGVALEIVKSGLDIIDDLTTEDNTKALSANQGYVLKGLIDGIVIPTVPENITDLDDVSVTSIQNGQVLAWNSLTEKFENVNQAASDLNIIYSTTQQKIGKWVDNKDVYLRAIPITANWSFTANTWIESNLDGTIYDTLIHGYIAITGASTSCHSIQIGIVNNHLAGNSFRNFTAQADISYLILIYTLK